MDLKPFESQSLYTGPDTTMGLSLTAFGPHVRAVGCASMSMCPSVEWNLTLLAGLTALQNKDITSKFPWQLNVAT